MADQHVQLVVLGGGPGGYPAAFAAADHGMKVVLIDEGEKPGGVCLNRGCIPSKALLHVAKLINEAAEAEVCGVTFSKPTINLDKLRMFKNNVVGNLSGGIESLCKACRVTERPRHFSEFRHARSENRRRHDKDDIL